MQTPGIIRNERNSALIKCIRSTVKWELHVWELKGDESNWTAQLENYYKNQPVLAMVSGLSNSSWQPIHDFCERFEIACLLPNTDIPVISENDFYTAYFSKGLTLEAQALANYLVNSAGTEKNKIYSSYLGTIRKA